MRNRVLELESDDLLQTFARHGMERARIELERRERLRNDPDTPDLFAPENVQRVAEYNEPVLRRLYGRRMFPLSLP